MQYASSTLKRTPSTVPKRCQVRPSRDLKRPSRDLKRPSRNLKPTRPSFLSDPPENLTISKKLINVLVDTIPETVTCDAKAHPRPNFSWFREGSTDVISDGRVFDLKVPVPKRSNGTYYCKAYNRHGSRYISMVMNVQCK